MTHRLATKIAFSHEVKDRQSSKMAILKRRLECLMNLI